MNPQFERRLRKLEEKYAFELSGIRVIKIFWAKAGEPIGLRRMTKEQVARGYRKNCDSLALDGEKINDDS